tara:strand:- start:139 stop:912 length:774 start_codon:yes stop_codon:yes gene_type:complete
MDFLNSIPHWILTGYTFILGLITGSFLNLCIHRLPREESVVIPRSHCPSCKNTISAKDNIPIVSYLLLKRKCRHCGQSISWVYPAVEVITAFLLTVVFLKFGTTLQSGIYGITISALVVITVIDLKHQIIPDCITLPGIAFGFAAGTNFNGFLESFSGFLLGGGLFYILALVSKGGMGGGDIKFIAGLGALLGWQKILLVIFLAAFLGTIYSLPLLLVGKKGRKSLIPFGPFISAATGIAIFIGRDLIIVYIQYMNR